MTLTDDSGQLAETSLRLNGQAQTATGSPIPLTVTDDGGYLLGSPPATAPATRRAPSAAS